MKRGSKNGLFRTQIGLNITVSRALFHYGKIQVKCEGFIEDEIWQGHTDGDGSSHRILTILLPEKLKWPRPPAEFTGMFPSAIGPFILRCMMLSCLFGSLRNVDETPISIL